VVDENGERNMKEHRTRKRMDSTAGLVRHRTVGQEQKHAKQRKRVKVGRRCPPLMRPGAGIYMHESEIVKRQVLYAQGELEGGMWRKGERRDSPAGDRPAR